MKITPDFTRFARWGAQAAASPGAFVIALVAMGGWLAAGPSLNYNRFWELGFTIGVPVLTLLMTMVILHTQNHDTHAVQAKLDELIRAQSGARNELIGIEETDARHVQRTRERIEQAAQNEQAPAEADQSNLER